VSEQTKNFNPANKPGNRSGRGPRRSRPGGDKGEFNPNNDKSNELMEKVVFINRSAKVVKGGRRFNFSALVVVGDKQGRVGIALGKAGEVADAIRRGGDLAKQRLEKVSLQGTTIPHEVLCSYGGATVLLKPAAPGTGIIAGKTVRAVVEAAGVKNILSKCMGSSNAANVVKATLAALRSLRLKEDIYRVRGIKLQPEKPAVQAVAAPVSVN
jgi:small subunit ribosomal protein S5